MLAIAFSSFVAVASAASAHTHAHTHTHAHEHNHEHGIPALSHMVPSAFKDHAVKFAPESTLTHVSRKLSSWMGFEKGAGFLTVTGFSDDMCMHPLWESGANVGRCMMAVNEDGYPAGSFRNKVVEYKGRYEMVTTMYSNVDCFDYGMSAESSVTEHVDTRCHKYKVALDGAGTVGSYQFSWLPFETTPKLVHFQYAHNRAQVEYDSYSTCNEDRLQGGMWNITRFIIQKAPPQTSCYRDPMGSGRSYMTHCADSMNQGPGSPVNVWFNDDHCRNMAPESDMVPFDHCMETNKPTWQQIYGGARIYNSPAFGRMHGQASKLICFTGGSDRGDNPADKLTPWNTYSDIDARPNNNNDNNNGCNGSDCNNGCNGSGCNNGCNGSNCPPPPPNNGPPGCYGPQCHCMGSVCMGDAHTECSGDYCFCVGSGCQCDPTQHTCSTSASTNLPNHCNGAGCGWHPGYGGNLMMKGNSILDMSIPDHGSMFCEPGGVNCQCYGKGCMCNDWSCWCTGPDCSCQGPNCSANTAAYLPSDQSCAGSGCSCHGSCNTFGSFHCGGGHDCGCSGYDCMYSM